MNYSNTENKKSRNTVKKNIYKSVSKNAQKSDLSNPIKGIISANFLDYHSVNSHFCVVPKVLKNNQFSPLRCLLRKEVRV
jgi:predicted site-specific integrase-resolvase